MAAQRSFVMPPAELLQRYDVPGPRYTSYPTVPEWSERFGAEDATAALRRAGASSGPLSLYVHVPFCRELCTFCGCNVIVSHDRDKGDRYLAALRQELALAGEALGERRELARVHLGGGTPTWLTPAQLGELWRSITDVFRVAPGAEIAIEVDPAVTSPEQLRVLAAFGFNRISMGVQDFEDTVQRAINRIQTVAETRALVESARELGFASVNFDLIYGLPYQTAESWRRTLATVLELAPDRLAVFSLAYVPGVRPNQRKLLPEALPLAEAKLSLFALTHDVLAEAGMESIGMDHFARPEDELAVAARTGTLWRDFQGYTTRRADETVGFGLSSIGFHGGAYVQNAKVFSEYLGAVSSGQLAARLGHRLSDDDLRRREVITQIMCNFEIDLGEEGATYFAPELEALAPLVQDGLVQREGARLRVTPLGRFFVRNVAMVFDSYLRRRGGGGTFSRTV